MVHIFYMRVRKSGKNAQFNMQIPLHPLISRRWRGTGNIPGVVCPAAVSAEVRAGRCLTGSESALRLIADGAAAPLSGPG